MFLFSSIDTSEVLTDISSLLTVQFIQFFLQFTGKLSAFTRQKEITSICLFNSARGLYKIMF